MGERGQGGRGLSWGAVAGLGVVGLLCVGFGLLLALVMPRLLREQVTQNTRIDPSSSMYSMWKDLPVPFFFSFHLFEVMNSKEILLGAKPILSQRGPYVYRFLI